MNAPVPDPSLATGGIVDPSTPHGGTEGTECLIPLGQGAISLGGTLRHIADSEASVLGGYVMERLAERADALEALLERQKVWVKERGDAAAKQVATAAADAVEGAWKLLDCDECPERLAKLVDQWRAEAKAAQHGARGAGRAQAAAQRALDEQAAAATPRNLTLGARIRLAAEGPDVPSLTRSYLELLATDADTLTRVGERLVAAAQERPSTPAVGVRTSEGATGAPGGAHDLSLGDKLRHIAATEETVLGGYVVDFLADRADALEGALRSVVSELADVSDAKAAALAQIERVRALHQPPEAASPATRLHGMCLECSRPDHEGNPGLLHPWPCETVSMLGTAQ